MENNSNHFETIKSNIDELTKNAAPHERTAIQKHIAHEHRELHRRAPRSLRVHELVGLGIPAPKLGRRRATCGNISDTKN